MIKYKLIATEHRLSDRLSFYLYGIGGADESGRLVVCYNNLSIDCYLVEDLVEVLNKHDTSSNLFKNVAEGCLNYAEIC